MRYFLKFGYNGAPFHGWQRQPNALGVQEVVEQSLTTLLRTPTPVTGAGRTDTGVHARIMYAHFDTQTPIADKKRFLQSLNHMSGHDIAYQDLLEVKPEAHARFDASRRTYKYFITSEKSPFLHPYTCLLPPLDVEAMNDAAEILLFTDDFTSFAKLHSDAKTNICHVDEAYWKKYEGELQLPASGLVFTISADRFLRNMVRAIVGTLVDVGRGKLSIDGFQQVIEHKDRCKAGTSMPAQALFLWDVAYPKSIYI